MKFDFLGLKTLTVLQKAVELIKRGRGIESTSPTIAARRRETFELLAKATRSACSSWKARACATRCSDSSPTASRTSSPDRALPPGPDGQHPDLYQAQARRGAGRIPASRCSSRS